MSDPIPDEILKALIREGRPLLNREIAAAINRQAGWSISQRLDKMKRQGLVVCHSKRWSTANEGSRQ